MKTMDKPDAFTRAERSYTRMKASSCIGPAIRWPKSRATILPAKSIERWLIGSAYPVPPGRFIGLDFGDDDSKTGITMAEIQNRHSETVGRFVEFRETMDSVDWSAMEEEFAKSFLLLPRTHSLNHATL